MDTHINKHDFDIIDDDADLADILKAPVRKRSVRIQGHATSLTLEEPFWLMLKELAERQNMSLNMLIAKIDAARSINLSSAVRLYVLAHAKKRLKAF